MPRSLTAHHVHPGGFKHLVPLSAAWAWLDQQPAAVAPEVVCLAKAAARVLAEPVVVHAAPPHRPRSMENGYAVRSTDCDGASAYNPLPLKLGEPVANDLAGTGKLIAGTACLVTSGSLLPSGADAVLPLEAAQMSGAGWLEVLAPVAPGTGIERWRNALHSGALLLEQGQTLQSRHLAYLATMGVDRVAVVRRPRVAIVVPGAKSGHDALTTMLRVLLGRDDALVEQIPVAGDDEHDVAASLSHARLGNPGLVLIAGRAGTGPDDIAVRAVETGGGNLALHGIGIRPGMVSGMGTLPGGAGAITVPVILLPGDPFACLVAYDLLAARLVRRLACVDPKSAYQIGDFELARKIVSELGIVEIVPVRLDDGRATPVGADLAGAVRADGFVMVGEGSEGSPPGSRVRVHLYNTTW